VWCEERNLLEYCWNLNVPRRVLKGGEELGSRLGLGRIAVTGRERMHGSIWEDVCPERRFMVWPISDRSAPDCRGGLISIEISCIYPHLKISLEKLLMAPIKFLQSKDALTEINPPNIIRILLLYTTIS
jgi:hypothetical protein